MVHESPENERFVEAYRSRWGGDKVTHFVSEPSYFQVYLFKQAVEKLSAGDITPPTIAEAVKGEEMIAPQGRVRIEPENLHTYLWPKIAQCQSNGQFEVLVESGEWIKPLPYAAYPGQVCTESGLQQA
jgi:urea transport system substrate-binding protein